MRAALLTRFDSPLVLAEIPEPVAGVGEVIVRTAGCGICRTDIHIIQGSAYRPKLPHILGHEPAGYIADIGPEVEGWSIGERVAPYLFDTCGQCESCRAGADAQCTKSRGVLGVTRDGGFAEFFRVRADNLFLVPASVDLALAGLSSCAVITAVHAKSRAGLTAGQSVGLIGAGGIGLVLLQALVADGHEVHVIELSERGRQASLADGAASASSPEQLAGLKPLDRIFDLVGTRISTSLAGQLIGRRGRIVIIGEEPESPAIDTITLAQKEIEIVGSRNGSRADVREALRLLGNGTLHPKIAARVPLEEVNSALNELRSGQVHGRIVVEFPQ